MTNEKITIESDLFGSLSDKKQGQALSEDDEIVMDEKIQHLLLLHQVLLWSLGN